MVVCCHRVSLFDVANGSGAECKMRKVVSHNRTCAKIKLIWSTLGAKKIRHLCERWVKFVDIFIAECNYYRVAKKPQSTLNVYEHIGQAF